MRLIDKTSIYSYIDYEHMLVLFYNRSQERLRESEMATVKVGKVTHTWLMSNKNDKSKRPQRASIDHYVTAAAVTAYNAAADDAARAATLIGALISAENALSIGVHEKVDVGFSYVDNAAIPPAVSVMAYAFDKIGVSFFADGEYYVSSIPARSKDPAVVTLGSDGITIDTGAGASTEVTDYIAAFNAVVLSEELVAGTVVGMNIRS
jgi:hypothetical protein